MRWEYWKKLTEEEKEEYMFKFGEPNEDKRSLISDMLYFPMKLIFTYMISNVVFMLAAIFFIDLFQNIEGGEELVLSLGTIYSNLIQISIVIGYILCIISLIYSLTQLFNWDKKNIWIKKKFSNKGEEKLK